MFFKKGTIRYLVCLLLMSQGLDALHAQTNNFVYKLSLDSVSFAGTGLIRIRNDDNTFFYDAPHWTTRFQKQKPVGYRSGVKPSVRSVFKIEGVCNPTIFVKGEASNGMTFPIQQLRLNAARTNSVYDFVESNIPFENGKVNYFENFSITWYYAETANATRWVKIGTSGNKMYVTKEKPLRIYDTGIDTVTFHTTIYMGCNYAKGETSDPAIVEKVYKQFQTLNLISVDNNRPMRYWGINYGSPYIDMVPGEPTNSDVLYKPRGLFKHGEGTCQAWAIFFIEVMRSQGITGLEFLELHWTDNQKLNRANSNVLMNNLNAGRRLILSNNSDPDSLPAQFFVKQWDNPGERFFELDGYSAATYSPGGLIAEIDKQGIKAQSMANPWSMFTTHVIVRYNKMFYDPSYGTPPTGDLTLLQNNSIAFFGSKMMLQEKKLVGHPPPNETPTWFLWIKPASVNDKLSYTIDTRIHDFR
jgi:hypothetical protein